MAFIGEVLLVCFGLAFIGMLEDIFNPKKKCVCKCEEKPLDPTNLA